MRHIQSFLIKTKEDNMIEVVILLLILDHLMQMIYSKISLEIKILLLISLTMMALEEDSILVQVLEQILEEIPEVDLVFQVFLVLQLEEKEL